MRPVTRIGCTLAIAAACGRSPILDPAQSGGGEPRPSVAESCSDFCGQIACDGASEFSPEIFEVCIELCESDAGLAADAGKRCDKAFAVYVECIRAAPCEDFLEWLGGEGAGPCRAEASALPIKCPDVDFAFAQ